MKKAWRQGSTWAETVNIIKVRREGLIQGSTKFSRLRMSVTPRFSNSPGKKPFHQRIRRATIPLSILLMNNNKKRENPCLTPWARTRLSFFFRPKVTRHSGISAKYHSTLLSISASSKRKVKQEKNAKQAKKKNNGFLWGNRLFCFSLDRHLSKESRAQEAHPSFPYHLYTPPPLQRQVFTYVAGSSLSSIGAADPVGRGVV